MLNFKKYPRLTIILITTFVAVLSVGFSDNRAGSAPTLNYPFNESGQTYGSVSEASSLETLPDLIHAGSIDGVEGYVYTKDLLDALPKTPEDAIIGDKSMPIFSIYAAGGKNVIGSMVYSFIGILPESVRNEYVLPIYPVNENGQTYGPDMNSPGFLQSPDLIACVGIDGKSGYCYKSDLDGELPNNPDEAVEYMKRLEERYEEMRQNGEKYFRIIPLYSENGETVIGEFGIG